MYRAREMDWEERETSYRSRAARPRILVVEDDHEMRRLVVMTLEGDGYRVIEANSGDDAVAVLDSATRNGPSQRGVELVLSDIRMAHGDGFQVGTMIRDACLPIPVIFMTAFPSSQVQREAARIGAKVLAKPFPLGVLRRMVVEGLVERAKARASSEDPNDD